MATVSDFGSLEVKRVRIDEEIAAVRYGTEIMDRDLIFKAGDMSHPNQSIRFAVHNGESYTDAFAINANGFAVTDLKMSGPSTGVSGRDDQVLLGEMRVEHFDDHANVRAGEINFALNIGDTDTHTIHVMSLTPEEISLKTPTTIADSLSCSSHFTSGTLHTVGNTFRSTVATFAHPLTDSTVLVERADDGVLQLNGRVQSDMVAADVLSCAFCETDELLAGVCSVGAAYVSSWKLTDTASGDLAISSRKSGNIIMNADVFTDGELIANSISVAAISNLDTLNVSLVSSRDLHAHNTTTDILVTTALQPLVDAAPMQFGTDTLELAGEALTLRDGALTLNDVHLSPGLLLAGGVNCANGALHCEEIEAKVVTTSTLLKTSIIENTDLNSTNITCSSLSATGVVSASGIRASAAVVEACSVTSLTTAGALLDDSGLSASKISTDTLATSDASLGTATAYALTTTESHTTRLVAQEINTVTMITDQMTTADLSTTTTTAVVTTIGSDPQTSTRMQTLPTGVLQISSAIETSSISLSHDLDACTVRLHDADDADLLTTISLEAGVLAIPAHVRADTLRSEDAYHAVVSTGSITTPLVHGSSGELELTAGDQALALRDEGALLGPRGATAPSPAALCVVAPEHGSALAIHQRDAVLNLRASESASTIESNRPLRLSASQVVASGAVLCDALSAKDATLARITLADSSLEIAGPVLTGDLSATSVVTSSCTTDELHATIATTTTLSTGTLATSELRLAGSTVSAPTEQTLAIGTDRLTLSASHVCELDIATSEASLLLRVHERETTIDGPPLCVKTTLSVASVHAAHASIDDVVVTQLSAETLSSSECSVARRLTCPVVETETTTMVGGGAATMYTSHGATSADPFTVESSSFTARSTTGYVHFHTDEFGTTIGTAESGADARLHVHARPLCPAMHITGESGATIDLFSADHARAINFRGTESGWTIGVANLPPFLENTFGIYHHDSAFLTADPVQETMHIIKPIDVAQLSVAVITMGEVRLQDCLFSVTNDRLLSLDCDNFEVSARDANDVLLPLLSVSQSGVTITPPLTLSNGLALANHRCVDVATPIDANDATNRAYVDDKFDQLFTTERVLNAPLFFAPLAQPTDRSFSVGLGTSEDHMALHTGTTASHSLRFISGITNSTTLEVFASNNIIAYSPVEFREPLTLQHHTITSSTSSLEIAPIDNSVGTVMRLPGVSLAITTPTTTLAAPHPLHVVGTSDDLATFETDALRSRINISTTDAGGQAMSSCTVGGTTFSSGYHASADAYVVASSTDLSQNTHLVISRESGLLQSSGDIRIERTNGEMTIQESGATTFLANKNTIQCQNFGIAFNSATVNHTIGGSTIMALNTFGANITGSAFVSGTIELRDITISETEIGDLNISTKLIAPDVETDTVSLNDRLALNLYQDPSEIVRFRENGYGMLLDFDKTTGELDFSLPTAQNTNGRGQTFASDVPILCLQTGAVGVGMRPTESDAKFNISADSGPHLGIKNSSAGGTAAAVSLADNGDLAFTCTSQNFIFNGDITSDALAANNFVYIGAERAWRIGTQGGNLVIQSKTISGTYETKQTFEA